MRSWALGCGVRARVFRWKWYALIYLIGGFALAETGLDWVLNTIGIVSVVMFVTRVTHR